MRQSFLVIAFLLASASGALRADIDATETELRSKWSAKFISLHSVGLATFCVKGDKAAFEKVSKAIAYGRDFSTTFSDSPKGEVCGQIKLKAPDQDTVTWYRRQLVTETSVLISTGKTSLCVKDDDGNTEIEKFQYLVRKAGYLIAAIDADVNSPISVRVPHYLYKLPNKEDANRRVLCLGIGVGSLAYHAEPLPIPLSGKAH